MVEESKKRLDKVDLNDMNVSEGGIGLIEPKGGVGSLERESMRIDRFFSREGMNVFNFDIKGNPINWLSEDVSVTDDKGKIIYIQPNVKRPDFWSSLAIKVVASKYFWGNMQKGEREDSVEKLIGRVSRFFERQALKQKYFDEKQAKILRDEIAAICLNQMCVFNSPVWFNVGIQEYDSEAGGVSPWIWDKETNSIIHSKKTDDRPQCSACFILGMEDNMDSIMEVQVAESTLFRGGSGAGSNRSPLRSSKERLMGGGKSCGPVAFMKGYDAYAGVIKSGGKTRRAAKMEILNIDHPDIIDFIEAKPKEEKKAWALIEQGYDGGMNGEAYSSIFFQNSNMSVRASDDFMKRVIADEEWNTKYVLTGENCESFKAKDILRKISEGTHVCGDPGIQFDTTINKYHTCKNSGRINASNPCSEYLHLDDTACNLASINLLKFRTNNGDFDVEKFKKVVRTYIIAMDLIIDGASYPLEKIAKNANRYRQLGLGYANLGALLMSLGLPYDSDEGRAVAASITAIMGGEAYKTSAELARLTKPFSGYEDNKEPMLKVMEMHRDHVKDIDVNKMPSNLRYLVNEAWDCWSEAVELGEKYGYRNSQGTVLAPTGCLVENSLISTDKGLVRLRNLGNKNGEKWQETSFKVMTDQGPKTANKFYINGMESTRKIKTKSGYEIQGTEKHKVKILNPETNELMWKKFSDLNEGDIIPLAMNTIFGNEQEVLLPPKPDLHWNCDYDLTTPKKMTKTLSEIVGYYMGDGSFHGKGLRFCVDNQDEDVVEHLSKSIKELFNLKAKIIQQKGYKSVEVNSVPLTIWWEACGFKKIKPSKNHIGKGYIPYIPDAILHTNNKKIYSAFLRGLFEADGTVNLGVPSFTTAHNEFSQEIKTILLSLGYPTILKTDISGWGKNNLYVSRLKNISYNEDFNKNIGFISRRKINKVNLSRSSQSGKRDYIYVSREIIDETVPVGSAHRDAVLLSLKKQQAIPRERIIQIYKDTENPQLLRALQFFYDKIESNTDGGIKPTYDLSVPENVTYIANGFVSHNTIAFMMDCDTTGIEPDIALVKYKVLAGGGMLKIVNQSVALALENLGYSENEINEIVKYVNEKDMIEGAPYLKEEHLPIFDCAFKAANGKRAIQYKGHIKMMGVTQPFISGAISKTINMSEESTVDDISDAYIFSWQQGLKAVAIYRENSKRSQPLNTQKTEGEIVKKKDAVRIGERKELPQTRKSITHKFDIAGHKGFLTVGLYDDGSPGEIFVSMAKMGSTIRGLMDSWARSMSYNLQSGISADKLFIKFRHQKFEPAGFVKNEGGGDLDNGKAKINTASSIVDYVSQFMLAKFGNGAGKIDFIVEQMENPTDKQKALEDFGNEGLVCPICGGPAKRLGNCATVCTSCKQTTRTGCGE